MTYHAIDQRGLRREFNNRLNEAAQERLARRIQANQPNLHARVRQTLATVLTNFGFRRQRQQTEIIPQA